MRDDNVVDYPWLLFSVGTLMEAYARMHDGNVRGIERERVVEGLLNGLDAGPVGLHRQASGILAGASSGARGNCVSVSIDTGPICSVSSRRTARSTASYSPIGLQCNFLSNMAVAMVALALAVSPWSR